MLLCPLSPPPMSNRVTVIGAGIVGICSALQLQRRGFNVTLLDRKPPASETSSGNAGVISRGSIFPEAAPGVYRKLPAILSNRSRDARLHYGYFMQLSRWGRQALKNSRVDRFEANVSVLNELVERCLSEHQLLLADCGGESLLRENGWLKLFRDPESFESSADEQKILDDCGVEFQRLGAADIAELEKGLNAIFAGGLLIKSTASVSSPSAVCELYAKLFVEAGGDIVCDDYQQLEPHNSGWRVNCAGTNRETDKVVMALGAWSKVVLEELGYKIPMVVERGYHMHYDLQGDTSLGRPVFDVNGGYVMSPMQKGLRVTTGVEWGSENTAPTPVQVKQVKPFVQEAIDINTELDPEPWLGRRPCTPDSLPVISAGHKHTNLWAAFGHGHMGFSMGPITGRLLAEMISSKEPVLDTKAFSLARFE